MRETKKNLIRFLLRLSCDSLYLKFMKKIALYIAEQQDARLKALAARLGVTQAELFRRFLEEGLVKEERAQEERDRSAHARH